MLSGVLLQGADLHNSSITKSEMARADARSAKLDGVNFTDSNLYGTKFDGASLVGAIFENTILTGATFGRDGKEGPWADLTGAHFEGALISSSDVGRICENPTLVGYARGDLGCRRSK